MNTLGRRIDNLEAHAQPTGERDWREGKTPDCIAAMEAVAELACSGALDDVSLPEDQAATDQTGWRAGKDPEFIATVRRAELIVNGVMDDPDYGPMLAKAQDLEQRVAVMLEWVHKRYESSDAGHISQP